MAKVNVAMALMSFNNTFSRLSATPLDSTSVHYSFEDAQSYATSNPYAYVGQIISVVDASASTSKAYMIMNTAGDLEEIGSGSGSTTIVADEAEMLALQDLEVGQVVFREDTSTTWIYKGPDSSQLSSWQEVAAQNDTVWDTSVNKVLFSATTLSAYNSLETKNPYTLYLLTDVGKIYKGGTDVTSAVVKVDQFPEAASAVEGKLYIGPVVEGADATGFIKVKVGTELVDIVPGYYTDGANWANANSQKFATIGLIKKGIQEAVDAISLDATFDNAAGTVKVGTGAAAILTGVAHNPTYVSESLTLTIPVYGGDDIVVNIPKDKFVTAGQYYVDYPNAETATHHNVIVLTIDNQSDPVIIPAEALVNIYTADNEGKNVVVTVTDDNKISATVTIDPAAGNALTYSAAGFKVDISGKMDTYGAGTASEIVVSDAAGKTITRTGNTVLGDGSGSAVLGTSTTQIPVASVIARAIATAVSAAQSTLQGDIDGKMDKLSGTAKDAGKVAVVGADGTSVEIGTIKLADLATQTQLSGKVDKVLGTQSNLVAFGADGAIVDSGKSVGGTTLSTDTTGNVVATEAAVNSALSWKVLE